MLKKAKKKCLFPFLAATITNKNSLGLFKKERNA